MKKEVFIIVLAFSIIFISSCTDYPGEIKYSPSNYIDELDLGEDTSSHNFNCDGCFAQADYDCQGDQRMMLGCATSSQYLEFKMSVYQNQKNILLLQTSSQGTGGYRKNIFRWYINGELQGNIQDYRKACTYLPLEIPEEYTSSGKVTLKFTNIALNTPISCATTFSYVHAYTIREVSEPECSSDSACSNGYCMFPNCIDGCTVNKDCILNHVCDTTTNNCVPEIECISDTDCLYYEFCNEENQCRVRPGNCNTNSHCGLGYTCINHECIEGELTNITEPDIPCTTDDECAGNLGIGYGCVEGFCALVRQKCGIGYDACEEGDYCTIYGASGYCEEIVGYNHIDVSNAIDDFDLGEDQTSHNYICYTDPFYNEQGANIAHAPCERTQNSYSGGCFGDLATNLYCGGVGERIDELGNVADKINDYLSFEMDVTPNQENVLGLRRTSCVNLKSNRFEWFVNDVSQGIAQDEGICCELFLLDIPAQNTGKITLKFKSVLSEDGNSVCPGIEDFSYTHAYMFEKGSAPQQGGETDYNLLLNLEMEKNTYLVGEQLRLK